METPSGIKTAAIVQLVSGLLKELGTRILVSSTTASRTAGFELRFAGSVDVRGKTDLVELYELRGAATDKAGPSA